MSMDRERQAAEQRRQDRQMEMMMTFLTGRGAANGSSGNMMMNGDQSILPFTGLGESSDNGSMLGQLWGDDHEQM